MVDPVSVGAASAGAASASSGSVLGPALLAGGGILSTALNIGQNQKNIAFQKDLATKGVQWKVADMIKAGINPILAANPGASAQASGGSNIPIKNPMAEMVSALQLQKMDSEIELLRSQTRSYNATAKGNELANEGYRDTMNQWWDTFGDATIHMFLQTGRQIYDTAGNMSNEFKEFVNQRARDSAATVKETRALIDRTYKRLFSEHKNTKNRKPLRVEIRK